MHALSVLHRWFAGQLDAIHATRRRGLFETVCAAVHSDRCTLTALAHALDSPCRIKHRIKRVDRLLCNSHLQHEAPQIYGALAKRLLHGVVNPLVLVDWSDLTTDQSQHLLRAVVPMDGRPLVLYEEVHPRRRLGNRRVQQQFLHKLHTMLPPHCRPIIVADAGFKAPFYQAVEALGWHWVGRLRGVGELHRKRGWINAKALYALAGKQPRRLGQFAWTRAKMLAVNAIVWRKPRQGRRAKNADGSNKRSGTSQKAAQREREPWLLLYSLSLSNTSVKHIVRYYRTRMQIEESFRDMKSACFGLGLSHSGTRCAERWTILVLINSLALCLCWLIGLWADRQGYQRLFQSNTEKRRRVFSFTRLGGLLMREMPDLVPARRTLPALSTLVKQQMALLHQA